MKVDRCHRCRARVLRRRRHGDAQAADGGRDAAAGRRPRRLRHRARRAEAGDRRDQRAVRRPRAGPGACTATSGSSRAGHAVDGVRSPRAAGRGRARLAGAADRRLVARARPAAVGADRSPTRRRSTLGLVNQVVDDALDAAMDYAREMVDAVLARVAARDQERRSGAARTRTLPGGEPSAPTSCCWQRSRALTSPRASWPSSRSAPRTSRPSTCLIMSVNCTTRRACAN